MVTENMFSLYTIDDSKTNVDRRQLKVSSGAQKRDHI